MQRYLTTIHTISDIIGSMVKAEANAMIKAEAKVRKKGKTNEDSLAEVPKEQVHVGQVYTFNNIVQRGLVWNSALKSDLICTVMEGGSIPPIYVNSIGNNIFDVFDGKQRLNALYEFYTDKFRICKTEPFKSPSGETINLNGKKYSQLSDEQKSAFLSYTITRVTAENLTQEEMNKQFRRLNAGRPLTPTEKSRAYIKSLAEFGKLSDHIFFQKFMDSKNRSKSKDLTYVKNIYAILFFEEKSLLESKLKAELVAREMTQDEYAAVEECLDYMYNCMCILKKSKTLQGKKAFSILKNRITHFVIVAWLANSIKDTTTPEAFCNWLMYFFYPTNLKKSTVSDDYNDLSLTGTSSPKNIARKLEIVTENFDNFIASDNNFAEPKQISFSAKH